MSDKWYISGPLGIGAPEPGAQLEIGGALIATKDGDELVGLKIRTDFDDNGKSNVRHHSLVVYGAVAMGQNTMASGQAATAMGQDTTASGSGATTMGIGTTASGQATTAMGQSTTASGSGATTMGVGTTAGGEAATAMGAATTASERAATAMGEETTASGRAATAMGTRTTASEYAATAMGEGTTASGRAATAMGASTTASAYAAVALGENAKATHERSFVWSDGSPSTSMNSQEFRIRAAAGFWVEGTAHATGGWAAAGTDYAEYFESTQRQKIQVGMTVALANGKIRVAQAGDIPIGVISANPVVLGGAYAEWPNKYVRDEFGQVLMESYQDEVLLREVHEQGKPVVRGTVKFVTKQRARINPAYDPTKKYIPRAERPEWNCVGLLGQLPVRKGQVVAPNWIKIRELSPNVDLWLVK